MEGVAIHGTAISNLPHSMGDVKAGASSYYRSRARYSPLHKKEDPLQGVAFGSTAPRFNSGDSRFSFLPSIGMSVELNRVWLVEKEYMGESKLLKCV